MKDSEDLETKVDEIQKRVLYAPKDAKDTHGFFPLFYRHPLVTIVRDWDEIPKAMEDVVVPPSALTFNAYDDAAAVSAVYPRNIHPVATPADLVAHLAAQPDGGDALLRELLRADPDRAVRVVRAAKVCTGWTSLNGRWVDVDHPVPHVDALPDDASASDLQAALVADGWVLAGGARAPAVPWERAGGPDECPHGYAAGVPCPRCEVPGDR